MPYKYGDGGNWSLRSDFIWKVNFQFMFSCLCFHLLLVFFFFFLVFYLSSTFYVYVVCCMFKYNQVDKHFQNWAMQRIISKELSSSQLLCYEEAFAYEKTKVSNLIFFKVIF